jgi:ferredoxin
MRAKLIWETCVAYKRTPCDACHRACPVDLAITIDDHGHPRLDRYRCDGCGECLKVCPTDPISIVMAPHP